MESHPDADRLSFVFLETEAAPFLDGRLVQVDRRQDHEAEIIRQASFYLRGPDLHLHSYLDDWIDLLFSWVKYFFVGDLWWRRFEEMQGYEGYAAAAPYDCIIVTAAPRQVPTELINQLKPGGRIVIPVGDFHQELQLITKAEDGRRITQKLLPVRFVPMVSPEEAR